MLRKLTFRMQIFLASVLMLTVPMTVFGFWVSTQTSRNVTVQYQQALSTVTAQVNLNLDTLLSDAEKLGNLHILNDDIRRALLTDYGEDYRTLVDDNVMMLTQITQANQLNTNVVNSVFFNRYGYTFEYNLRSARELAYIEENLPGWEALALENDRYIYFGPIQPAGVSGVSQKNVIPIVKILRDAYSNNVIGTLYAGLNFDAVAKIIDSASLDGTYTLIYDQDNQLLYSSHPGFTEAPEQAGLMARLAAFSGGITREEPSRLEDINVEGQRYTVNALHNPTTSWRVVQFMDNSVISGAFRQSLGSYSLVFLVSISLSMLMALLLSHSLSRSIKKLCRQIDSCEVGDLNTITLGRNVGNAELGKVTESYNRLNRRLADSLEQNYEISLQEKQMRIRMLKAQINPHFLYNTLNLVGSIANIHGLDSIKTIVTSMSDILRYNLRSGSMASLREEVGIIRQFVTINQVRFPGRFEFACDVPPALLAARIPAFILQPIVENSIQHGHNTTDSGAVISIVAYAEGADLHILVSDNGSGIPPETLQGLRVALNGGAAGGGAVPSGNIGILNVHQRIHTCYGGPYGVSIESVPGRGTIVDIRLPLEAEG